MYMKHFLFITSLYYVFRPFELHSHVISGDNSGVLHIGPGQTIAFRQVDEIEAFTNVFVYEGGTLHLPSFFRCRDVNITVWSVSLSLFFSLIKKGVQFMVILTNKRFQKMLF